MGEQQNVFRDVDRIKSSLCNLKGFVFDTRTSDCSFLHLATNILDNVESFSKLQSIHAHTPSDDLTSLFLNEDTTNANPLSRLSELCIPLSLDDQTPTDKWAITIRKRMVRLRKLC